ncbi:sensor histidine kinase [Phycicoccus sp. M110.8]|uniref:sensor histidine kinase n=1 Tax=Phycicoccus sp. M110.8 TaxID=3075433 RepID=UPI0028FD73F9|nr:sensor histidine kinase [Phycicoccus sp. M110.8]MDU0315325.1 sensor histidine kinase [Phycicoccus sp. M110.8]
MPRLGRTLAARILAAVLGIVVVTLAVGFALFSRLAANQADAQAREQAAGIAEAVGRSPEVARALADGDPGNSIPALAERVRSSTHASYVVVIDRAGTRHSHPNPALIGQRVEEPVVALDGRVHTGMNEGSLGRSANAKAPVVAADGSVVGEVSVGILETQVSGRLHAELADIALYCAVALALGVGASLLLARAIKRVTFGLEPAEIVGLVQEREAMLHGIREGVLGVDAAGGINVLNDEARRLLGLQHARLGQRVEELLPEGRVRRVVTGEVTGSDLVAVTDEHLLVLNRRPVTVAGRDAGSVVTIRDRTEMEALLRQLDSMEGLSTALRAQEHEFSNRLHVLAVLLELGEVEEATRYSSQLQSETTYASEEVRTRIGSPVVAALLLAKATVAAERDVAVRLAPESLLRADQVGDLPLVSVLGNLVDNAVDAIADDPASAGRSPRGTVTVTLTTDPAPDAGAGAGAQLRLVVEDTGPGIPPEQLREVFVDGFTTKDPRGAMRRGVGLALVHRLVTRAGGTIFASSPAGARFEVVLPLRVAEVAS